MLDKGNYSMFAPPRPILPGTPADLPELSPTKGAVTASPAAPNTTTPAARYLKFNLTPHNAFSGLRGQQHLTFSDKINIVLYLSGSLPFSYAQVLTLSKATRLWLAGK